MYFEHALGSVFEGPGNVSCLRDNSLCNCHQREQKVRDNSAHVDQPQASLSRMLPHALNVS
jgi:hypothetical protein